ncbi:hypothetical protein SEUCBS139899_007919 [Sporothrix eucalyptigena]|uniref:DUF7136 domain-containing protein n=1 Tax=Sporothrix eucalyptigena TaxID=1812306 RepID=A0ABP0CDL3_9PEZI
MLPLGMLTTLAVGTVLQFASPAMAANAVTYPATVELDLVFPRNGSTYSPGPKFPVVFAVQNAPAADSLEFFVEALLHNSSQGLKHTKRIGSLNATGNSAFLPGAPNTFYWSFSTDKLQNETETQWSLAWVALTTNVSDTGKDFSSVNDSVVFFTTKPGAPAADLVALANADAASNSSCSAIVDSSFTYNITGIANITDQDKHRKNITGALKTGAVLSTNIPAANPCAARLDPAAASNIATALNSSSNSTNSSTASQPKKNGSVSVLGRQSSILESAALLAVVGLFVYM